MEEIIKQNKTNLLKITTYGPESTGKTTLAQQLATHFKTNWVQEYAREYLSEIKKTQGRNCVESDLIPIINGQVTLENQAASKAQRFLFCDTNALVTKAYSSIYFNSNLPALHYAAQEHYYDLYLLTDIDMPWSKDEIRDSEQYRDQAFSIFKNHLTQYNKPFIQISGTQEQRLKKAIQIVTDCEIAIANGLSVFDYIALYHQNKKISTIVKQIQYLKKGIEKIHLERAAKANEGIVIFNPEKTTQLALLFDKEASSKKLEKFIPASGAATRMFQFLNEFLNQIKNQKHPNKPLQIEPCNEVTLFIKNKDKFPFYKPVMAYLKKEIKNFEHLSNFEQNVIFIQTLLENPQFNYLNKPKAVLPFHNNSNITPVKAHLNEVLAYASNNKGGSIHFTITEEHLPLFKQELNEVPQGIAISFSYQCPTTNSIALDQNDNLMKDINNQIVFKPGGHGALLYNLNQRDADIIFIKNIDNIGFNTLETTTLYKKALAGYLLSIQSKIFFHLAQLETPNALQHLPAALQFIQEELPIEINKNYKNLTLNQQLNFVINLLDRPIRVCGMVKNENQPGGGPFWIKDQQNNVTLQIVEYAQIDTTNTNQKSIFANATHFNPVDLVCSIKNHKGEKFDLLNYTNPDTGFIVKKTTNGASYSAYELPGLWNGSMANWITLFVEVPQKTFSPVKTVTDLLKPLHQPKQ